VLLDNDHRPIWPVGLFELAVEQVLRDGGVPACGGVRQVEDQGQVQWVWSGGQRLVQHAVAADAVEADTLPQQMKATPSTTCMNSRATP